MATLPERSGLAGDTDFDDMLLLIPYIRASPDVSDPDARRQLGTIREWAQREGYTLIAAEEEIGTGASQPSALERPSFLEACRRAKATGSAGIIMETPDVFSSQDPKTAIWEWKETERRFDVHLYFACVSKDMQSSPKAQCLLFIQQAAGHP